MLFILLFLTIYTQFFHFNYALNKNEKSSYNLEPLRLKPNGDGSEIKYSRISDKKCKEYQEPIYDLWHERDVSSGRHIIHYIENCPHDIKPYVVGGSDAAPKEFPHMALIGSKQAEVPWFCGGTLISEEFVLTAAHCSKNNNHEFADIIRLGELDYAKTLDDADPHNFDIIKRILHDNYNSSQAYNDIALFKINSKVNFTHYIRPACLSTNLDDYNKKNAIASGWGATAKGAGSPFSNKLKKVVLETFDYDKCNEELQCIKNDEISQILPNLVENKTQICFGSHTDTRDICFGDSGGPLQLYHHDFKKFSCMYSVIGITSVGGHLCGVQLPGIFIKIYPYLDWIEKIVWPNEKL